MNTALNVVDVTAGYGSVTVLNRLSIKQQHGEHIGLFGPNGHGKTTLLRAISGLLPKQSGSVSFMGQDITTTKAHNIVAMGLVHALQGNTLFGDMGVAESIALAAFTKTARREKADNKEKVYSLFPRLAERRKQKAKTLSGGERQMLSIGAALMCAPRLLILDEPTLGLSPRLKDELTEALLEIRKTTPLIVVEQDIQLLLDVTDRLYLISHGEVERTIDRDNAPDHREIMATYFGEHS